LTFKSEKKMGGYSQAVVQKKQGEKEKTVFDWWGARGGGSSP